MPTRAQFRHEDVSSVPRGWKVRTVSHPTGHRVRIAFPPGPRRRGAGKLVSVLHPKRENPVVCVIRPDKVLEEVSTSGSADASNPKKQKTREQVEKLQAKAVKFLRDVVKDDEKADEIEDMSVADYAAKKKITLSNPKRTAHKKNARGKKNQEGDQAASLYRTFHGEPSREVLEFQMDVIRRKDYAALGHLIEVHTSDPRAVIDWPEAPPLLATNSSGTQLYVIGGDQNLNELLDEVPDKTKDFLDLGPVAKLIYRGRKDFDGFEEIDYVHAMGDGGHGKPRLLYDKLNRQIYFVGGEYKVKREGIVH